MSGFERDIPQLVSIFKHFYQTVPILQLEYLYYSLHHGQTLRFSSRYRARYEISAGFLRNVNILSVAYIVN